MKLRFTVTMEFGEGRVDGEFVQQALTDALWRARDNGVLTPDDDNHAVFIAAEVEPADDDSVTVCAAQDASCGAFLGAVFGDAAKARASAPAFTDDEKAEMKHAAL